MDKPKQSNIKLSSSNQQSVNCHPDHITKEQQAATLIVQKKYQEAEEIYKDMIANGTNNHIVYGNLAAICLMEGRYTELIRLLKKALLLEPSYPEAHYNIGLALHQQGKLREATTSYQDALKLRPNFPDAHYNLGCTLHAQGNLKEAINSYNNAIRLKPNFAEAYNNLGNTYQQLGDLEKAITSLKNALKINRHNASAHQNLGYLLHSQGDKEAAIKSYNTALKIDHKNADAHYNLGCALQDHGELEKAINSYKTVIQLNPESPDVHKNLSMVELLLGNYDAGLERYEYRLQCKSDARCLHARPKCQQWKQKIIPNDIQLVVISEGGLGDTLHFMRYIKILRNRGAKVSLCAQSELHSLIRESSIHSSPLTPEQANQVSEGYWIALPSVLRLLEIKPDNPVTTEPYIKAKSDLQKKWSNILAVERKPIIGIHWQGEPSHETYTSRGRSLPLETFAPIANKTNSRLLSLQKGSGSEQLEFCSFREHFVNCQDQISKTFDFLETAAHIANCDLVITNDTSLAHLAGGMGKTTWLLLKKVPEWRWGLEGNTSFWYPTMRLFRQKQEGNWKGVMERVTEALQEYFDHISE